LELVEFKVDAIQYHAARPLLYIKLQFRFLSRIESHYREKKDAKITIRNTVTTTMRKRLIKMGQVDDWLKIRG
jgi:hypothetical protein